MFYNGRKSITPPTRRVIKTNLFQNNYNSLSENLTDISRPNCSFNITCKDGELTQGYGSQCAQIYGNGDSGYVLPQPKVGVDGLWHYKRYDKTNSIRDDRLILHTAHRKLLCLDIAKKSAVYREIAADFDFVYSADSYRIGDEDILLLSTESGFYKLSGDTLTLIENAPKIKNLCLHNERAFATVFGEGNQLYFSKSLDPTDWTISSSGGGYIEFTGVGGKLTALISFMGFLFVFREYGIERVSAYAEQSEFSIKKIYSSTDRIIEKSVVICGDVIIFASETGLKSFDGANVIDLSYALGGGDTGNFTTHSVGTYFRGSYMLSCYHKGIDFEKTESERETYEHNNALFLYELKSKNKQFIADHDISGFCFVPTENTGELLFFINPNIADDIKLGSMHENRCIRLGVSCESYWRTGMTDLGLVEKRKFLKSIELSSQKPVTVGVILDDKTIKFEKVKGNRIKLFVNHEFEKIGFYFSSKQKTFRISSPVITIDMR